ncbi:GntR family transcriptional regulator [Microbacterium sp. 5K110]|uniref:GntR family transcriptional regulator n=1 Tax=Microbacterium sp. 5K110 TaxID=2578104 RepID=UPI001484D68F|nr:GntR family transcriptional regulator [Microbacterium sp. 5K110]
MAHTIERVSPVPYYEQLFEILRDRIAQGDIAEEERLPSELELCREFGLSRATVRRTHTPCSRGRYPLLLSTGTQCYFLAVVNDEE